MKAVYLFCNFDWGLNFLKSFIYFSSLWKKEPIIFKVILSKKNSSKKAIFRHHVKILLKKLQYQSSLDFQWVENVNTVEFGRDSSEILGIIAGFNQIFKKETIKQFHYLVNFHPSILPLYKGPSPLLWNLKLAEDRAGFTVHKTTERIDEGEVLYQDYLDIRERNLKWLIHTLSLRALPYFLDLLTYYVLHGVLPPYRRKINAFKIYKNRISYVDKHGKIIWFKE